jgi:hypothetical protein
VADELDVASLSPEPMESCRRAPFAAALLRALGAVHELPKDDEFQRKHAVEQQCPGVSRASSSTTPTAHSSARMRKDSSDSTNAESLVYLTKKFPSILFHAGRLLTTFL